MEMLHQVETLISDRYQIVDPLDRGGIGITYTALHSQTDKLVAAIAARASLFFVFFSLPFCILRWGLLGNILFAIAGSTRLEIDPQTLRLRWNCLGFNRQIEEKRADIDRVELLGSNFKINDPKQTTIISCALVERVNTHRFGSMMTQLEKESFLKEVAAFLRKSPSFNY